jgi:hypothetical protein
MNRKKLDKLWKELSGLRAGVHKARELQAFAKKLGRESVVRGKEPAWESTEFDGLNPVSIPDHGGKDLANGTQKSILDSLEDDLLAFEERVDKEEKDAKQR